MKKHNYMVACKFKVEKTENGEHWFFDEQKETCNEMMKHLELRGVKDWKRLKHVFYFKDLYEAMLFKLHYYDHIKYAAILDENLDLVSSS